jgi:hypothetical protein
MYEPYTIVIIFGEEVNSYKSGEYAEVFNAYKYLVKQFSTAVCSV